MAHLAKEFFRGCIRRGLREGCKIHQLKREKKLTNNWYAMHSDDVRGVDKMIENHYCMECGYTVAKYGRDAIVKTTGGSV